MSQAKPKTWTQRATAYKLQEQARVGQQINRPLTARQRRRLRHKQYRRAGRARRAPMSRALAKALGQYKAPKDATPPEGWAWPM
jgi:hypothetical protein